MINYSRATREELIQAVELLTKKYSQASEELKRHRWVSVDERFPIESDWFYREQSLEYYILTLRSNGEPDIFSTHYIEFFDKEFCEDCGITHWMPVQEIE